MVRCEELTGVRGVGVGTRHRAIVSPNNFKKNASIKIQIMRPKVAKQCDLALKKCH